MEGGQGPLSVVQKYLTSTMRALHVPFGYIWQLAMAYLAPNTVKCLIMHVVLMHKISYCIMYKGLGSYVLLYFPYMVISGAIIRHETTKVIEVQLSEREKTKQTSQIYIRINFFIPTSTVLCLWTTQFLLTNVDLMFLSPMLRHLGQRLERQKTSLGQRLLHSQTHHLKETT